MTSTAVEDCILSVDSIIRLGGAVADDDSDDESERIQTALLSAGRLKLCHLTLNVSTD